MSRGPPPAMHRNTLKMFPPIAFACIASETSSAVGSRLVGPAGDGTCHDTAMSKMPG